MITAGVYGLIGRAALFIGALIGLYMEVSKRVVRAVMAFGSGVLISALTFDLIEKAYQLGGFDSVSIGFIVGAVLFVGGDYLIDRGGGHLRKRGHGMRHAAGNVTSGSSQLAGSGSAILLGALLDGIPESAAIGVGLAAGKGVGLIMLVAVFLSNLPEGISGALGMKESGRSATSWWSGALQSQCPAYLQCWAIPSWAMHQETRSPRRCHWQPGLSWR